MLPNRTLFYSPTFEETGIGRVLLDVGGLALLRGVDFAFSLGRVFIYFAVISGAFVASISRRHWRHFVMT